MSNQADTHKHNHKRSEFFSHLTHDVRTVVNGLEGVLSILDITNNDEKCQEYIDAARMSAHRLAMMLLNILETARVESGNMRVETIPYKLRPSMADLIDRHKKAAVSKDLTFHVHIDDAIPDDQHGDPAIINRILGNLLDNAIRYTYSGDVSFTVECLYADGKAARLRYVVEDSGAGMPSVLVDCMFEPYKNHFDTAGAGSRLGLPLSAMLSRLLEGQLRYELPDNRGSRFVLDVPVSKVDVAAVLNKTVATESGISQQARGDARILIVDDDILMRKVVVGLLKMHGLEVDIAENGMQAIERCQSQFYDLIFLDSQMPLMDGNTTCRKIRDFQKKSGCLPSRIISMTGNAGVGVREASLAAGMDDYLLKPVSFSDLGGMLEQWLQPVA